MNEETYGLCIAAMTDDRPHVAGEMLDKLSRAELDAFFERATAEQIAREDLREMLVKRML